MNPASLLIVGLIGAVSLASCGSKAPSSAIADPRPIDTATVTQPGVDVKLETVRRGSLHGTVRVMGSVTADANGEASLAFPIEGQLGEVRVNVGDRVSSGETLATLDPRLASQAIAQAFADLDAAEAGLDRARAGARPQELAQNDAALRAAQTKAQTARAEWQREQSLASVGIAARRDVEAARTAYADALADAQAKEQGGSLLRAGPRPQDVAVAAAAVRQAAQGLASARTRASLGTIVAPFAGIVSERLKNVGEIVDRATPVLIIVDPARSVVVAQLSESEATTVAAGDRATMVSEGRNATSGIVVSVGTVFANQTRTVGARIRPTRGSLVPGVGVRVTIVTHTFAATAIVPESAIVEDPESGLRVVFVPGSPRGTYRRVPIEIIARDGSNVAVRSSRLRVGERVVSQGAYELLPVTGV